MSSCLTVINTQLPPRDGDPSATSRSSSYIYTGLKPGVNENAFRKTLWFALVLLTLCLGAAAFAAHRGHHARGRPPITPLGGGRGGHALTLLMLIALPIALLACSLVLQR